MKAMPVGRPAVATLMTALALIIVIAFMLWVRVSTSPRVTASSPTTNFQLNSPAVIVPPPTITPLRVGALPTATPVSLAPQPPAAPPAGSHQNNNGSGDNKGSNKSKGKGHHKP